MEGKQNLTIVAISLVVALVVSLVVSLGVASNGGSNVYLSSNYTGNSSTGNISSGSRTWSYPDLIEKRYVPATVGKANSTGNDTMCNVRMSAAVRNIGNASANYSYTWLQADYGGSYVYTVPLAPQQATAVSTYFILPPGAHSGLAYADAMGNVVESNEYNNDYLMNFTVPANCGVAKVSKVIIAP